MSFSERTILPRCPFREFRKGNLLNMLIENSSEEPLPKLNYISCAECMNDGEITVKNQETVSTLKTNNCGYLSLQIEMTAPILPT